MTRRVLVPNTEIERPYSPQTLADRWGCGESTVRNLIRRNELATFRIGTLIRISAEEVERFECQNIRCNASEGDMPSSGTSKASEGGELYTPQIDRARKPRPAAYGKQAMTARGQLAG
jgi:excisionase family DNA binding protein